MSEIVVEENQQRVLERGNHRLRLLDLHRNATLVVTGPTVIFCDELRGQEGARIQYMSNEFLGTDNHFDLFALNAEGLRYLDVIGDGKSGLDHAGRPRARDGHPGRSASRPNPPRDLDGREASRGGAGSQGAAGGDGEPAADVVLNLPRVPPGARIRVSAVGGRGGKGQDGGNGGGGGNGAAAHGAKDGGTGGNGGRGGNGGDSGKIAVFVVVPDDVYADLARRDQAIHSITLELQPSAGTPGAGGAGGVGGPRGKGGPAIGPGHPERGPGGRAGDMGQLGDGPESNRNTSWNRVDVMSEVAYREYCAQVLANISRED